MDEIIKFYLLSEYLAFRKPLFAAVFCLMGFLGVFFKYFFLSSDYMYPLRPSFHFFADE